MFELVSPLCLILNSLEIVIHPTHCYSFYFIVFRAMVLRLQKHQSHLRLSKTQIARPYPRGSDSVGQVGPMNLHFYNLAFLRMLLVKGLPFVKHYCEVNFWIYVQKNLDGNLQFLMLYQDTLGTVTSFHSYFFTRKIRIWERNKWKCT